MTDPFEVASDEVLDDMELAVADFAVAGAEGKKSTLLLLRERRVLIQ